MEATCDAIQSAHASKATKPQSEDSGFGKSLPLWALHLWLLGALLTSCSLVGDSPPHPENDLKRENPQGLADMSGVGNDPDLWFHALEGARHLAEAGAGYEAARIIAAIAGDEGAGPAMEESLHWLEDSGLTIEFVRTASRQEILSRLQGRGRQGKRAEVFIARVGNLINLNRWDEASKMLIHDLVNDPMDSVRERWLAAVDHFQMPSGIVEKPIDETSIKEAFRKAHQRALWRRQLLAIANADYEALEIAHFLIQYEPESDEAFAVSERRPRHRWEETHRERDEEKHTEERPSIKEVSSQAIQKVIALAENHPEEARLLAEILISVVPDTLASQAAKGLLNNLKPEIAETIEPAQPFRKVKNAADDTFWETPIVRSYHLELTEASMESLRDQPKEYVRGVFRENGKTYEDVGVRLKGGWGSFRMLDGRSKTAFTIKFNQFKPKQRFHGLRRIILNNAVQDPSYMRECISYGLFRDAGIPAPRVAHATLTVNGEAYGLYVQVEAVTKDFLKRWFESASGNLYEGPGDVTHWEELDLDSNQETTDRSDLRELAEAIERADETDPWRSLSDKVDLPSFAAFLSLEQFINHWDGYTQINNYRIYHDPDSDRFHFFPHGADQVFEELDQNIFRGQGGILGRALLMTEEGQAIYRRTVRRMLDEVWNEERLLDRIGEIYERIHPFAVSEEGLRKSSALEFEHVTHQMVRFISMRRHVLERQLQEESARSWRDPGQGKEAIYFLWED